MSTATDNTTTVRTLMVRAGGEYGEFFVRESGPIPNSDGHPRYAATWVCYSSFGVFGHHWSHMGEPFADFIRGLDDGYLLSKIARRVFDKDKFSRWMRREIFTSRASREAKREAAHSFRELAEEHSGEALATLAYNDVAISHCSPEWTDCESRDWDPQAVGFVEKLWPEFVKAYASSAVSGDAGGGGK